ncbi:hypothetical protein V1512DRAFT_260050 [Lipomyces arxii]|uniref:uncharacterized protein n=1 Tax=Lipomyces arxii TaxID=56418 RepID=UPI0034CD9083
MTKVTEQFELDNTCHFDYQMDELNQALSSLSSPKFDFTRPDPSDYFDPKLMPVTSSTTTVVTSSTSTNVTTTNGFKVTESTSSLSSTVMSRSSSVTTNGSSRSHSATREKTLTVDIAAAASTASLHTPVMHRPSPLSRPSIDAQDEADKTVVNGSPVSTGRRMTRPNYSQQSVSAPGVVVMPATSPSLAPEQASTTVSKRANILIPTAAAKVLPRTYSTSQMPPHASSSSHLPTLAKLTNNNSTSALSASMYSDSIIDADEERDSFSAISPALVGQHQASASGFRGPSSIARHRTFPAAEMEEQLSESSDEVKKVRDEIIAKRENKRRRKEFLENDKVLVGTKVGEGHVNYVLAYDMLTGIRVAVSRTAQPDRELTDHDFTAKHKLAFDMYGTELTPSAKYDFKFKDYAPWVFRHLRQLFKIDPADYLMSLTAKYIVSELGSPGKSGSFFYFSSDYRFIIKTIHHSEHKFLLKILKEYYYHVKANPNTLISQFYGLHRVKLPYERKIHFVIMNNLFPPHRDIHQMFDLKGSTAGRDYDESKLEQNKHATMKDLNWRRRDKHINLGPHKRAKFMNQLEIDVRLLERLHIMDYSLLIGIHDLRKGNTEKIRDSTLSMFAPDQQMLQRTPSRLEKDRRVSLRRAFSTTAPTSLEHVIDVLTTEDYPGRKNLLFYADDGGLRATDEHDGPLNEIYYLGVIDCLTHYSFVKKLESFWKGMSSSRDKISAVPPEEYGERFFKFIKAIVKTPEELGEPSRPDGPSLGSTAAEISEVKEE